MKARRYTLITGLIIGISVGLFPLVADIAFAQTDINAENCSVAIFCQSSDNESSGGNAHSGNGGRGGNGGFASVHDIANAVADASSNLIVGDITIGDSVIPEGSVDATGDDVVSAGGGSAQRGTTGGDGLAADEAGGDGGSGHDATAAKGRNSRAEQARLVVLP